MFIAHGQMPDAGGEPSADVAATIRQTWLEILRVSSVDDGDDFFVSGGHSMLATRLMSRLRKTLGSRLPVGLVFEHPVFADLVRQAQARLAGTGEPAGPSAGGRSAGPVSLQQSELLRMEAALGPSPLHNVVVAVEPSVRLDPDLLRGALRSVLNRNPALRLSFRGETEQIVGPCIELSEVDLVVLDGVTNDAEIRRAVRHAHLRPHDLDRGNLLRAQLFRTAPRDLLVLHLHHLSVDGVSQAILLDRLSAAYDALLAGTGEDAPGDELSYLDYASWQRSGHDELVGRSHAHWRRVVADLALGRSPGQRPAGGVRYQRWVSELPAEAGAGLRCWARKEGATDFVACTSAVAAAVARATGRGQVGVGTLLDNRSLAGLEHTIGPFATSTLLAVDVAGARTPRDLVRAVRTELVEARRWAGAPLGALLDLPCAELGLEPGDLVDVVVAVDLPYRSPPGAGLAFRPVLDHGAPLLNATVGAPLSVSLFLPEDGGARIAVEAAGGEQLWADHLAAAVQEFAATPDDALPTVHIGGITGR